MSNIIIIDISQVTKLAQVINDATGQISAGLSALTGEFGAYMRYSAALEFGAVIKFPATRPPAVREHAAEMRRERLGIELKNVAFVQRSATETVVTLPPRPHIIPAINENKKAIVMHMEKGVTRLFQKALKGKSGDTRKQIENLLAQALNDKPRRAAIRKVRQQKIFEFGFHMRSIRGYAPKRNDSAVIAQQAQADNSTPASEGL